MHDIIIDNEFRDALRPLSDDELNNLTAMCLADGIIDPLRVWDEENILIDGHHRLAIAEEYDLDFEVVRLSFASRQDVLGWIGENQSARRNWTKDERNEWMRAKRAAGWTYQKIADTAGVSYQTAYAAASDVELIDFNKLPGADGKLRPATYQRQDNGRNGTALAELGSDEWAEHEDESEPERPHVSHNSGNNEWYTPAEFIAAARKVMGGIDTDPASSELANVVVGASTFYDADSDGLAHDWTGRVWMNPPYAGELIGKFTRKLRQHIESGEVSESIVLVNNATETAWFADLVAACEAIIFPTSRVKFWKANGETGAPLQGQAILYHGVNPMQFLIEFGAFGWGAEIA